MASRPTATRPCRAPSLGPRPKVNVPVRAWTAPGPPARTQRTTRLPYAPASKLGRMRRMPARSPCQHLPLPAERARGGREGVLSSPQSTLPDPAHRLRRKEGSEIPRRTAVPHRFQRSRPAMAPTCDGTSCSPPSRPGFDTTNTSTWISRFLAVRRKMTEHPEGSRGSAGSGGARGSERTANRKEGTGLQRQRCTRPVAVPADLWLGQATVRSLEPLAPRRGAPTDAGHVRE